jgi:ribosomal protein S18 acetylase RimI-like enzyme
MTRTQNPNNGIHVRPATLDDVPQLCELLGLLFGQEADFTPDAARQTRGLRLILEQPEYGRIFCAADGKTIVGMVGILFIPNAAGGSLAAVLEDMIVHPDRRHQGIGERLLNEAIAHARRAGCGRITLLTDATNESAMRFYRRSGFVRTSMTPMRLGLSRSL